MVNGQFRTLTGTSATIAALEAIALQDAEPPVKRHLFTLKRHACPSCFDPTVGGAHAFIAPPLKDRPAYGARLLDLGNGFVGSHRLIVTLFSDIRPKLLDSLYCGVYSRINWIAREFRRQEMEDKSTITYKCGHKDTLIVKPSPARRRALRQHICHNCYVAQAQAQRQLA